MNTKDNDLRQLIAKRQAVLVVGAGVSIAATDGAPTASWRGLLDNGVGWCEEYVQGLRPGWGEWMRGGLEGDLQDWLSVATQIEQRLVAGERRRWLAETIGKLPLVDPGVIEALRDLGAPILTTNYDSLIEQVTDLPAITWKEPDRVEQVLRGDDAAVVHLHGHWQQPDTVVLGISSYEAVLGHAAAQALQQAVRATRSLIYVGYGAGLEDPNFGELLRWARETFRGNSSYRHYRLALEAEIPAVEQGIQPEDRMLAVSYGRKHEDLAAYLRSLAPPREVESRGKPSVPAGKVAAEEPAPDPDLDAYRAWALDRYQGLSLIGVGGGEVRMRLEEVYVPLSIAARAEMADQDERHGMGRGDFVREMACEDVKLSDIFRPEGTDSPHAMVFGEPGAGKTTALVKLLHECLSNSPESLGLAAGTIPVLLPLRHIGEADLDAPLAAAIQKHLDDTADGKLASDLGERLWQRGNLLLLLDGLDEIADEGLRARVAKMLEWRLRGEERRGVRAVVSCRYAGYGGSVKLGEGFLHLDVRPLDAKQVRSLVQLWFREVQRTSAAYPVAEAQKAADDLCEALEGADFAAQKLKVLVSTPLLLTLMCVVVLRGGEMPRHRVAFYDQCLRVLLGRWGKAQGRRDPLLDADTALALLRPLAWRLHTEQRRDNLSIAELVLHIEQQLEKLSQAPVDPFELIGWLYRDAGVLEEYAQHRYGFVHLGLQEYLAALHVPSQGEELLEPLCTTFGEKWWREVVLLLVGLPGQGMFAPLMRRLLACEGWWEHLDLLRDALSEAAEVDLEPFLELLTGDAAAVRKAAVLRLLRGQRDPRLVERAAALTESDDRDVAALAMQIAAESGGGAEIAATDRELLLLHDPADAEPASELGSRLTALGLPVFVAGEGWEGHLQRLLDSARGVAVLVGQQGPWEQPQIATCLGLFDRRKRPLVPVRLPGAAEAPPFPEELTWAPVIDLSAGLAPVDVGAFERALGAKEEPKPAAAPGAPAVLSGKPVEGESFVEPVTGAKLLWIPRGRFEMGGKFQKEAQPVHRVLLSPFWLGETPVTNAQYGSFLAATEHREPPTWRDRRFSNPLQPVVSVSWQDAVAYCKWLSDRLELRVSLPSEARWEYAARGTDGREYPWGNDPPDESRACFDLDWEKGQPATVGSFPAGAGPYGTLDQAGNVWEWCLDKYDKTTYAKRASKEPLDPVVEEGPEDLRVLRGGAWGRPAQSLRAAFRLRSHPANRDGSVGFRVLVSPPST